MAGCRVYIPGAGFAGTVELEGCGENVVAVPAPVNLYDRSRRPRSLECVVVRVAGEPPAPPPASTVWATTSLDGAPAYTRLWELVRGEEAARKALRLLERCGEPEPLLLVDASMTRVDLLAFHRKTGTFPVQLLEKLGLLTPCTVLVNPYWVTSWELELVSESGAHIAVSVSDSLAAGSTPLLAEFRRYRVSFSLVTGHYGQTVVDEVRLAALVLRGFHAVDDVEAVLAPALAARPLRGGDGYLLVENVYGDPWKTLERLGSLAVKTVTCSGRQL